MTMMMMMMVMMVMVMVMMMMMRMMMMIMMIAHMAIVEPSGDARGGTAETESGVTQVRRFQWDKAITN